MIATVDYYRGVLPDNRVALYREICEVFLGKRQAARGLKLELNPAQTQLVLQYLAFHMMKEGIREIVLDDARKIIEEPLKRVSPNMEPNAFLQMVENSSSLLLPTGAWHLLLCSPNLSKIDLTAVHIQENKQKEILEEQVGNSWWRETILLYCALAVACLDYCCLLDRKSSFPSCIGISLQFRKRFFRQQPTTYTYSASFCNQSRLGRCRSRKTAVGGRGSVKSPYQSNGSS